PFSLGLTQLAMNRSGLLKTFCAEHRWATALLFGFVGSFVSAIVGWKSLQAPLQFIYSCFLKPLGYHGHNQQDHQADVYDATRGGLLRGRKTMLKLCAAQLKQQASLLKNEEDLIWIDIGGGTGWNIERMNSYYPIEKFHKVYLVDLTPSLCRIARERFQRRGWTNVVVLCEDAAKFELPGTSNLNGKIGLITMSYSLSMIDNFFPVIDRIEKLLSPHGIFGIADFYVSGRSPSPAEKLYGSQNRQCSWFTRFFWQIWFDFDHINLAPGRRDYVEYKFGTLKCLNARNHFVIPYLVQIPYYIWLGCSQSRPIEEIQLDMDIPPSSGSSVVESPTASVSGQQSGMDLEKKLSLYSRTQSQNYQSNKWRLPYDPSLACHKQFRSYIYAFTWEDPRVDLEHLDLTESDTMFVITSAGDNALEYAIKARPQRIHCIDMNPCQNHLLELKLASVSSLEFEDFWKMFGDGRHPQFESLLHDIISPHLSSQALQYWSHNSDRFSHKFYKTGYSGLAVTLVEWWIKMQGLQKDVREMCHAETIEEQKRIWAEKIRPAIFSPMIRKVLNNPMFMWNALGVPMNQMNMFLKDGTTQQYIEDTLEPIASRSLFRNDQYFFYLCLMQKYARESCPSYLTEEGFKILKETNATDAFRLHTDSIVNVLRSLPENYLTRMIVMDHMDWFSPDGKDLEEEIIEMARATQPNGRVYWRSAGKYPWYNDIFVKHGFDVKPISIRESGHSIDRVNMYSSFWVAVKL
ncbi:hypothetical protein BGW37DRAFT_498263, partial [Umbelopsis sp. PMI_123]